MEENNIKAKLKMIQTYPETHKSIKLLSIEKDKSIVRIMADTFNEIQGKEIVKVNKKTYNILTQKAVLEGLDFNQYLDKEAEEFRVKLEQFKKENN